MTDDGDDNELLNEAARLAAMTLRADVAVRPAWRAALLSRIDADGQIAPRRGFTIAPVWAMAASVLLLAVGAAGATAVMRSDWPPHSERKDPLIGTVAPSPVVRFVYVAPTAARVSVVGDFNQWNPSAVPLRKLNDGTWIADVPLTPGRYAYAFVVDGKVVADPTAPRAADGDFGVANSIVMVRGS